MLVVRLLASPAYKSCLVEYAPTEKDSSDPRGSNGALLWPDEIFDKSFTHQVLRSFRLWPPGERDILLEVNPGPNLFRMLLDMYEKEVAGKAAHWTWLGVQIQRAPASHDQE